MILKGDLRAHPLVLLAMFQTQVLALMMMGLLIVLTNHLEALNRIVRLETLHG